MDLYLRTDTESEMKDALLAAGVVVERDTGEEGMSLIPVRGVSIQWLGEIPPVYQGDVMMKTGRSGMHVNLRINIDLSGKQMAKLPLIDPSPTSPYCKFA
jgi:hypothetical protein